MKRTDVIKKLREMRIDEKKIGKLSWKFMSDDERMDALLSTIKDPDEAEQYIESEWDDLPPAVTQNMRLESINEGGMKINKNARRKVRPHGNVSAGNVAIRFDDKPFTVVGVGTVAELEEFDLDGAVKELDLDPDDEAIAVEDPNTGYAVYSYDLGGAVVYESKDTISMDRLKEIVKEEVINETRNLDKMQAKLRTVDNAQGVLRTLRDIISDTNTFNGQQFTKLEDIYEEIRDLKNDSGVSIGDLVSPAILAAFKKDMAEVPTVLSMLSDLEGDRASKYAEFGE
jgi:hypothetical protein